MRRSLSSISTSTSLLHQRADLDQREARVAAVGGVERRQAHEPVHALLGREEAVGVLAPGDEGGRLDARLLARGRLLHLDLEAALLRPAQVHAQQHLGPVLGVGAARAAVHGHHGVAGVVAPPKRRCSSSSRHAPLESARAARPARRASDRPRPPARRGPRGRRSPTRAPRNVSSLRVARLCSADSDAARCWSSQKPGCCISPSRRCDLLL